MADGQINLPEWTELKQKNGLDPLGMQNSSVNLYQSLLPGISNVTQRIRYYGLYAWLCRRYLQDIGDTNSETWKRFIRRAEALYALIAYHHGGENGVAGIEWAQRASAEQGDVVNFGAAAEPGSENYYLKQAWGIYGLAYRSQLFDIGIFDLGKGHDLPIPSPQSGEALAKQFEAALGDSAALFLAILDRGTVSMTELAALSAFSPSDIALIGAERSLYESILLVPDSGANVPARSRRQTLLLVLKIASLLGREPRAEEVRWILFAGFDQKGRALDLSGDQLQAHRDLWRIYQANDLCHVALETLLKYVLDTLALHPSGIRLQSLIPQCVEAILEVAHQEPQSWAAFASDVYLAPNAYGADDPQGEWSLTQDIMRSVGRIETSQIGADTAWKALKLLATLQKRVRSEGLDIARVLGVFDPVMFRSLLSESVFLEKHERAPFRATLAQILEERVVRRHLWVAFRKFRYQGDYTFLIEQDEGRLRCRDKDGPVFTNPRLGPAIQFLKDLHIIGGQGLTDYGAQALAGT